MPFLPNGDFVFLTLITASTNAFFSAAVMSLTSLRMAIAPCAAAGSAHVAAARIAASSPFLMGATLSARSAREDVAAEREQQGVVGALADLRLRRVAAQAGQL